MFLFLFLLSIRKRDRKQKANNEPSVVSTSGPSRSAKTGKSQGRKSLDVNNKSLGEKGSSLLAVDSRTCSRETSVCEEAAETVEQNPTYSSIDAGDSRTGEVAPLLNKMDPDPKCCESAKVQGGDADTAEEAKESTSLMASNVKDVELDPGEKLQVIRADIHAESDSNKQASPVFRPPGSGSDTPAGKAVGMAMPPSGKHGDKVHCVPRNKTMSPSGDTGNTETLPKKSLPNKEILSEKTSEKVSYPMERTWEKVANPFKGRPLGGAVPANSTSVMVKSSPSNGSAGKVSSPPVKAVKGNTSQRISTDLAPVQETIQANKPSGSVSDTALKSKPVPKPVTLSKPAVYSRPGFAPKHNGGLSENGHSLASTSIRPAPGTGQDEGGNTGEGKSMATVNIDPNNPCVVIEQDSLDSDSDLPDSPDGSMTKLPLTDSREHLAEIITTV